MEKEFCTYNQALRLKALGFDEPCFGLWNINNGKHQVDVIGTCKYSKNFKYREVLAPTFSQAINFLYICSNKQIDIELKASDTYEERLRKIDQGCEDLWNLQNSKSN